MIAAPKYRSLEHFSGVHHPKGNAMPNQKLDRKARNLEAARRSVDRLDRHADLDVGDAFEEDMQTFEMGQLLNAVASWISQAIGEHYGAGSWHASHQLRSLTLQQLTSHLIAWGASPFTIEQHGRDLLARIHSSSFRGGSL